MVGPPHWIVILSHCNFYVQQVTVQQHKVDGNDDDEGKEYTTKEVSASAGAPIHLHIVDEDNRTIKVLNGDNQVYVTNFNWRRIVKLEKYFFFIISVMIHL
jgi:hypothetical protein